MNIRNRDQDPLGGADDAPFLCSYALVRALLAAAARRGHVHLALDFPEPVTAATRGRLAIMRFRRNAMARPMRCCGV